MKIIVGLGNPGVQYANTRHNLGFMAIDAKANELKQSWKIWGKSKNSDFIQTDISREKTILLKPLTYMNLSGQSVVETAHFYKVLPEDICIIHDDVDLEFGAVRLKIGGGHGGHNGLKSINQSLSSSEYARIRMGIGRSPHPAIDTADFVLAQFKSSDWPMVEDMVIKALQAIDAFCQGTDSFKLKMNELNRRQTKE